MSQNEPTYCRLEARQFFAQQMPILWTTEGLLRAAVGVSMHALDDIDPSAVEQRLADLSSRVRSRAVEPGPTPLCQALHEVLFSEEDFEGNTDRYYHALNSYVPAVLNTKRGLPIVLSIIYKVVGEWAGLNVAGVNAPGHFMVRVRLEEGWQIVDPFFRGQLLSREEIFQRFDKAAGAHVPRADELLAAPSHVQWIQRLIGNLRQLFMSEGRRDDLAAMNELLQILKQAEP